MPSGGGMTIAARLVGLLLLTFVMLSPARAYDTKLTTPLADQWKSIFICSGKTAMECLKETGDEHPAMSDIALQRIGAARAYGTNGRKLYVTDLNASLFNLDSEDMDSDEPLIQREIPAPANFSVIPDVSYTIYDWVNKNTICPALPDSADAVDKCHEFSGWLGGGLNSSHFGSLTAKIYTYLHKIALKEAAHARSLREKIAADGKVGDENLKFFVTEAEFLALAYEGYAQHFLADRWSVGHMWERWNSPDYKNRAYASLDGNFEIGMAAGLLHGSQGVTGLRDPMSSPFTVPGDTTKTKFYARYRHEKPGRTSPAINAIGDMRVYDIMLGNSAGDVARQSEEMFDCLAAGWSEVIRAFGPGQNGGFGSRNVKLRGVTRFKALKYKCDDVWATNHAIFLGWNLDWLVGAAGNASSYINLGHMGYTKSAKALGASKGNHLDRASWIAITARVTLYNKIYGPGGIELARGKIGSFGSALTGDHYSLPDYLPPEDLNQLPDQDDKTGRDKHTLFGLFNKAHADYWCGEAGVEELTKLRESGTEKDLAACRYIAARFYEGTKPKYLGKMQERRTEGGGKNGDPSHGICYYYGARKLWNPNPPYNVPVYLSPGYVSKPYKSSRYGMSDYESVANWCEKIPIFDYVRVANNEMPDETVYRAKKWDEDITLKGENLGSEPGNLWINCDKASKKHIPDKDISLWNDYRIKFRIEVLTAREKAANNVTVCVETDKDLKSVGRFVISVEKQPVHITNFKVRAEGEAYVSMNENILKPIPPGPASYEVTFSELMDRSENASVAFEGPPGKMEVGVLHMNTIYIKGRWVSDTVWRGEYDNPASSEETTQFVLKDRQPVLIQAKSLSGASVETGEKNTMEGVRIYGSSGKAHEKYSSFYNRFNHEISVIFGEKEKKPSSPSQDAGFVGCWIEDGKNPSAIDTIWREGGEYLVKLVKRGNIVYSGNIDKNILEIGYIFKNIKDFQTSPMWTEGGIPDKIAPKIWPNFKAMKYSLTLTGPDKISGIFHGYHISYDRGSLEINWQKHEDTTYEWQREKVKIHALDISGTDKIRKGVVGPASELFIGAESEPGCDLTRDRMTVQLYPDKDKDEAVDITLIESEVDSNEYFLENSLIPMPPKGTSPAWGRPFSRLTVTQKGSMRGASIRIERKVTEKSTGADFPKKKTAKDKMDPLGKMFKDMEEMEKNIKRLKAENKAAARAKAAEADKAKGKKAVGGAGQGRGVPPVPGGGPVPGPGKGGVAMAPVVNCSDKSPDPECWTDAQLRTEIQRLETLFRRINGGEGVKIYKRHYKLPDGRLVMRLESREEADYAPPYGEMTNQSRFIRKQSLLDALHRAKADIEAIVSSR